MAEEAEGDADSPVEGVGENAGESPGESAGETTGEPADGAVAADESPDGKDGEDDTAEEVMPDAAAIAEGLASDPDMKSSVGLAILVFLFTISAASCLLLVGNAIEFVRFGTEGGSRPFAEFLLQFSAAYGGAWWVGFKAAMSILALYFAIGFSKWSWNVLAYMALAAMIGAVVIGFYVFPRPFDAASCNFNYVIAIHTELYWDMNCFDLIRNDTEQGKAALAQRGEIVSGLRTFLSFAILANFMAFLSFLRRDVAYPALRNFLGRIKFFAPQDAAGQ